MSWGTSREMRRISVKRAKRINVSRAAVECKRSHDHMPYKVISHMTTSHKVMLHNYTCHIRS